MIYDILGMILIINSYNKHSDNIIMTSNKVIHCNEQPQNRSLIVL